MDKFVCVGKNYLDHAQELGDAVPEMPVLFLKPPSVAIYAETIGETLEVKLPTDRGDVHYECEIVVRIDAESNITAVTLGLDLTLRDLQAQLKKDGHPWEIGKVFAGSAIVGKLIPIQEFPDYLEQTFSFSLDGEVNQFAAGREMRLQPRACISLAQKYFPLVDGDLFFTGTPAGVGVVKAGQRSELRWNGRTIVSVNWT